jgi:hypothetical protein
MAQIMEANVEKDEPISIQLVQFALAKLNHRMGCPIPVIADNRLKEHSIQGGGAISSNNARNMRSAALHSTRVIWRAVALPASH